MNWNEQSQKLQKSQSEKAAASGPYWPFCTQAEFEEYEEAKKRGYIILSFAHQSFMNAVAERKKEKSA